MDHEFLITMRLSFFITTLILLYVGIFLGFKL